MRATILIPFLGYMVLLNEQLVQYLRLAESLIGLEAGERAEGSNILEENRLKLIYIGLVILGLASSLYALFCPGMIQKFGSDAEYLEAELKSMSPDKMRYLRLQVSKHDNISSKWYGSWFLRLEERYKNYHDAKIFSTYGEWIERNRGRINDYLMIWYQMQLKAHFSFRMLTIALYVLGFAILSAPSIDVFVRVISTLL